MVNFDELRSEFPITKRFTFMNHAAISPVPVTVTRALDVMLREYSELGIDCYPAWIKRIPEVRGRLSRLIGADPHEIAFVGNTSEGLGAVASGIDWKQGDVVLVPRPDFPANIYPWMNLERRGVKTVFIEREAGRFDVEALKKALCPGVRLISVSTVDFSTGFLCDLEAIGAFCREKGILLCVDAIQSVGAVPIDVKKCGVHFLAAGGHKWLLSTMGCGILYISGDCSDQIHPERVGWKSVIQEEDFFRIHLELKRDALRFEPGTMNVPGIYALGASVELLLSIGVKEIYERILKLNDAIHDGLTARGLRVATPMGKGERSGILSFIPKSDPIDLYRTLTDKGVRVSLRNQLIRISPHFYNNADDISHFFDALDAG
ncbi:MAG: aminotransferase class V-fold PLP-dependent enzyme [Deltaproteobacteria bacterium]|nr:aminotransferase class V-fold PLP-dependent enzyme [Deltaproteobacteria bacterium]